MPHAGDKARTTVASEVPMVAANSAAEPYDPYDACDL
jgi:hypothetical protein